MFHTFNGEYTYTHKQNILCGFRISLVRCILFYRDDDNQAITTTTKWIRTVSKSNAKIMQVDEFETGKLTPTSNRNNECLSSISRYSNTVEGYQICYQILYIFVDRIEHTHIVFKVNRNDTHKFYLHKKCTNGKGYNAELDASHFGKLCRQAMIFVCVCVCERSYTHTRNHHKRNHQK